MSHPKTSTRFFPAIAVVAIVLLSGFNEDHTSNYTSICKYALMDEPAGSGEALTEDVLPYQPLANMLLRF